jgi:hypothetical protein
MRSGGPGQVDGLDAAVKERPSPWRTTTEVVTAIVSAAGLIYVLGGFATAVQLWVAGVPAVQAAVAPLPREYAITVALSEVIGPGVLIGLAGIGVLLAWRRPIEHDAFSFHRKPLPDEEKSRHGWRLGGLMAGAVVVLIAPGLLIAWRNSGVDSRPRHLLAVGLAFSGAVVAVTAARLVLNYIFCHSPVSEAGDKRRKNVPPAQRRKEQPKRQVLLNQEYLCRTQLLSIGAVVACLGMVLSLIGVGARELPSVSVYTTSAPTKPMSGNMRYIGQTETKTYVTVPRGTSTAVMAIGDDQIARVEIGE